MKVSFISWYKPDEKQPENVRAVLVVYETQVWSGVYAKDTVVLYPEDFPAIKLTDCDLWAYLPTSPLSLKSTEQPDNLFSRLVFKEHPNR